MFEKKVCVKFFIYKEFDDVMKGFVEECEIGRGSFFCVYKGDFGDGCLVVVKVSF